MKWKIKKPTKDLSDKANLSVSAALERAKARIEAMKVRLPPRPMRRDGVTPLDPHLPADLTALNDIKLGRLFSEFACMAQYCAFTLAMRGVEHSAKKGHEKYVRAKVQLEKTGTVIEKGAKVEVDPRTKAAVFDHLVGEGTEALTKAIMDGYLIGRDACSREMTRRQFTQQDPNPRR